MRGAVREGAREVAEGLPRRPGCSVSAGPAGVVPEQESPAAKPQEERGRRLRQAGQAEAVPVRRPGAAPGAAGHRAEPSLPSRPAGREPELLRSAAVLLGAAVLKARHAFQELG